MRAVSLLGVFILAKLLVLAGRDIPLSPWVPWAYLWQDVLVVLLFAALDHATRRLPGIGWSVYAILVLYTAINVPITCTLSTPLTWPLLRAAGGPLAAVRNGDLVALDVPNRRLDLLVDPGEVTRRLAEAPRLVPPGRGYGWLYARHVLQADAGCDFDFLRHADRR